MAIGLLLPYLFTLRVSHEAAEYYRSYPGASTDGDSIGIPVLNFALLLWAAQLVATALAGAWHLVLVRRIVRGTAFIILTILPVSLHGQVRRFVVDPAWLPSRIEQPPDSRDGFANWDVLHFATGKRLVTRLFGVQVLGQLPRAGRAPFLLVGGHACDACDVELQVYVFPADADSLTDWPPHYYFPGTLSYGESEDGPSYKGRLFIGRCLADQKSKALWFQSERDSTGKWEQSVFELSTTADSLRGRFLTPRPQLAATLARVSSGKCFEVPGIENWGG